MSKDKEEKKEDENIVIDADNREEIEVLKDKCLELEDKYKRALADYQNLLKQTAQEKIETVKYANEVLLQEIIPVYDNLKISMQHINEDIDKSSWLQGITYVIKQFKVVLEKLGVEEIDAQGQSFDHHTMEAIDKEMTTDESLDGKVVKELKSGYKLYGKVISAARVVVYEYKGKLDDDA